MKQPWSSGGSVRRSLDGSGGALGFVNLEYTKSYIVYFVPMKFIFVLMMCMRGAMPVTILLTFSAASRLPSLSLRNVSIVGQSTVLG